MQYSKFKNKTICVTGGAGFIGSHLVERLSKLKCKIIIIDNLSTGRIENIKEILKKKNIKFLKRYFENQKSKEYFS